MSHGVTKLLLIDINILGIGAIREYEYRDRRHHGKGTGAMHGTFDKLARCWRTTLITCQ